LRPVTAGVAQARVVLQADVEVHLRPIVRVERGLEREERLEVLRWFDIHALLVIERHPGAEHELRAIAVDQTGSGGRTDLRPQRQPETLVGLESAGRQDERALPRVS